MGSSFLASDKKIIKISDGAARENLEKFVSRYQNSISENESLFAAFHLREFDITAHEQFEISRHFREVTTEFGLGLIVHRDPKLAFAVKADAVHMQFSNLNEIQIAKSHEGLDVGVSCHSIEEALIAEKSGADYVYLSPIFETLSKQSELVPLGLESLFEARGMLSIPVVALGGIQVSDISVVCPRINDKAAGISIG